MTNIDAAVDHAQLLQCYARKGDADAFAALVHAYQDFVWSVCRRQLGPAGDAEAATQETFLRLARHAGRIRGRLGAWLHRCAMNVCRDQQRRDIAREKREQQHADVAQRRAGELTWPEIEAKLDAALALLSDRDRDLIVQHYLVGRPQNQLAAEHGVTPQVIHRRIHQSVAKLRAQVVAGDAALSVGGLAALLAAEGTAGTAPATLTASLTKIGLSGAGVASTSGAVIGGAKLAAGLALAAALTGGAVVAVQQASPTPPPTPPPVAVAAVNPRVVDVADLPMDEPPDPDLIVRFPDITPPTVDLVFMTEQGDVLLITDRPANRAKTMDATLDWTFYEEAVDNWGNRYVRYYELGFPHPIRKRENAGYQYYMPVGPFERGEEPHRLRLRYTASYLKMVKNGSRWSYDMILDEQWIDLPEQTIPNVPEDWPNSDSRRAQAMRLYSADCGHLPLLAALDAADAAELESDQGIHISARYHVLSQLMEPAEAAAWYEGRHRASALQWSAAHARAPSDLATHLHNLWLAGRYDDALTLTRQVLAHHEQGKDQLDEDEQRNLPHNWQMSTVQFYLRMPEQMASLAAQDKPVVNWVERTTDGRVLVELGLPVRQVDFGQTEPVFDWQLTAACHAAGWQVAGQAYRVMIDWETQEATCDAIVFTLEGTGDERNLSLTLLAPVASTEFFGPKPLVPWTMELELPATASRSAAAVLAAHPGLMSRHVHRAPTERTRLHELLYGAALPFELGLDELAVGPLRKLLAYTQSDAFDPADPGLELPERHLRERAALMLAEALIGSGQGEEAMAVLDAVEADAAARNQRYTTDPSGNPEYLPQLIMAHRAAWAQWLLDHGQYDRAAAVIATLEPRRPQWHRLENRWVWEQERWPGEAEVAYRTIQPRQREDKVWEPVDVVKWRLGRR